MRIAIPAWAGRVSTVLDFARRLVLLDIENAEEVRRSEVPVADVSIAARTSQLSALGVDVLICGAVSRPLADLIVDAGIELVPFVAGAVDDVFEAYLNGSLQDDGFLLPGCRPGCRGGLRRRWRFRGG